MIGSIAVSLAYRQDQHQHLLISHLIDQAKSGGTELDLVAVGGSAQLAGWDAGLDQTFGQLFLELLSDPERQLLPLPQCLRLKGARSKGIKADLQRLLPIRQPGIGDAA